jgi:hypothetical protein
MKKAVILLVLLLGARQMASAGLMCEDGLLFSEVQATGCLTSENHSWIFSSFTWNNRELSAETVGVDPVLNFSPGTVDFLFLGVALGDHLFMVDYSLRGQYGTMLQGVTLSVPSLPGNAALSVFQNTIPCGLSDPRCQGPAAGVANVEAGGSVSRLSEQIVLTTEPQFVRLVTYGTIISGGNGAATFRTSVDTGHETVVPEPSSLVLAAAGLVATVLIRRQG